MSILLKSEVILIQEWEKYIRDSGLEQLEAVSFKKDALVKNTGFFEFEKEGLKGLIWLPCEGLLSQIFDIDENDVFNIKQIEIKRGSIFFAAEAFEKKG